MTKENLTKLACRWRDMIGRALELKTIPSDRLQRLLRDTYEALHYYEQDLVPRQISKVLLEMEAFLYFASVMEDNEMGENFYFYQAIYGVVKALEEGFLNGGYVCVFPVLKVEDPRGNLHFLDLENGRLEELL